MPISRSRTVISPYKALNPILLAPVKVSPGETSEPFTAGVGYSIQSGVEKLPLSAPGLLVASSPEGHLDARAINALAPSLKVDIITTESAVSQYLFLLELSHCAPNGGSSGIRAGSTSIKFTLVRRWVVIGHLLTITRGFPLHDTSLCFP
ncbi:hypothetical protein BJV77DRAFT_718508 [Russula vinacea]|nr:hypothetical protein BJV77DRAFT_718508 [Russula vinacea]